MRARPNRRHLRAVFGTLWSLVTLLLGCSSEQDFARQGAQWTYLGQPIEGADAKSFQVLDKHHARDRQSAWYCDTERKGQEYFLVRHVIIRRIDRADAASFSTLKDGYARDRAAVYFEGRLMAGADPASFEPLYYGFARDARQAWHDRVPIPGSRGADFHAIDVFHAEDGVRVYHALRTPIDGEPRVRVIEGVDRASFQSLEAGWARDAKTLYFAGRRVAGDPASHRMLDHGYSRTADRVFYVGQPVSRADAASFEVLAEAGEDGADASDAKRRYRGGETLKP